MAASRSRRPLLDTGREYLVTADLEAHPRQRAARRPGSRTARRQIEVALMARTPDVSAIEARHDGARQMRAFLAVGDQVTAGVPHQETRIVLRRVCEGEDGVAREIVHR